MSDERAFVAPESIGARCVQVVKQLPFERKRLTSGYAAVQRMTATVDVKSETCSILLELVYDVPRLRQMKSTPTSERCENS